LVNISDVYSTDWGTSRLSKTLLLTLRTNSKYPKLTLSPTSNPHPNSLL
jgi:hypothetical protein